MKIVSFGDSFIFGTELPNNENGSRAWPGLIASELGIEYQTCAIPGCGNDAIARQIYEYFDKNSKADTLAAINWTWAARWDLYLLEKQTWITIGSTCNPTQLGYYLTPEDSVELLNAYTKHVGKSLINNRWRTLQTINSVQKYLKDNNIVSIETCIDPWLFAEDSPGYILELQRSVQAQMQSFEGQGFLDWSRSRGFAVTDPGWHPLDDAHYAAKELWIDRYKKLLNL